jgi:KDO2-lipid IV(A) lauroyltransferase
METALYWLAFGLVKLLQALPLPWVAWIGRQGGGLAYWLDLRHRQVALDNLARCFGQEKSRAEIRALARENFRRLGENYCSAIKTSAMTWAELTPFLDTENAKPLCRLQGDESPASCVVAIGHYGNFELYARFGHVAPGFQCATTYRALRQASLNRLLQALRQTSGCLFFERRSEANALKTALGQQKLLLGLLADQHAGTHGVRVPFFGHDCSTSTAPAILALRYHCRLFTGFCFRTSLAHWSLEVGEEIPTHQDGRPRPIEAITLDINQAFERAVRRDPANWFWVHNRWKVFQSRRPQAEPGTDPAKAAGSKSELPLS